MSTCAREGVDLPSHPGRRRNGISLLAKEQTAGGVLSNDSVAESSNSDLERYSPEPWEHGDTVGHRKTTS
jgi:hypothetical protein